MMVGTILRKQITIKLTTKSTNKRENNWDAENICKSVNYNQKHLIDDTQNDTQNDK